MADGAAAAEAYARLCRLLRLHEAAPRAERATIAALALRAVLHPDLAPWRADPLLPLGGGYVSLDAHVEALAALVPGGDALGPEDVAAVAPCRRAVAAVAGSSPGAVGCALWIPGGGAAARCFVRAAVVEGDGFGAPEPVRVVAPSVAASAASAWECANRLAGLGESAPQTILYDVCSPNLSDAALAAVAGDSLGLPLALAFLSALLGKPVPPGVGATGRVNPDGGVLPVGWVAEKAWLFSGGLFLAPAGDAAPGVLPVATLGDAAAAVGLATPSAGLDSAGPASHPVAVHLPDPATPFFGREGEVALLAAMLRSGSRRLVTLLGPGGAGKSRLALRVAAEAASHFPDGVTFVPLETVAPGGVMDAVAAVLRDSLGLVTGTDSIRSIGGRRLLLVLDNFEGALPDGADAVSALLSGAPNLACLVTSRAPLLLRAEQRHEVAPLGDAPAADLFRDRARAVRPDFNPAPAEVAAVCRRLDGLPLALELAAARLADRSLPELSSELAAALVPALASEWRDLPPRQRTMVATLEWSCGLLSEGELRAFRALSVFAGEFTAEDARAVAPAADPSPLARQSLLRETADGVYRMLPLLREFAAARLMEAGEADAVRGLHAAHLLDFARRQGAAYGTAGEVDAFDALARRWDDLKAAWGHLTTSRPADAPAFAAALCDFLRRRGHAAERGEWPRAALALIDAGRAEAPPGVRARLRVAVGLALKDAGDDAGAEREGGAALALAEGTQAVGVAAEALNLLGLVAARSGRMEEARRRLEDARARFAAVGSPRGEAVALNNLGKIARDSRDVETARRYHKEALALARSHGDLHARAYALNGLGNVALDAGDTEEARAVFTEYLEVARRLGDYAASGTALFNLSSMRFEYAAGPGADAERRDALPGLIAAEAALSRIGHRSAAHVTAFVDGRAGPDFATTLHRLRTEFARRSLPELLDAAGAV